MVFGMLLFGFCLKAGFSGIVNFSLGRRVLNILLGRGFILFLNERGVGDFLPQQGF